MAKINFGGVNETVITRKEFPVAKAKAVLKKEVIAVLGYGVQGPAQALNMKDNGFNVIIGQAKEYKKDWNLFEFYFRQRQFQKVFPGLPTRLQKCNAA